MFQLFFILEYKYCRLYIKKQIYSTGSNEKCVLYNSDPWSVELISFSPLKLKFEMY